jgi:uncharacterized protein with ParB-like and HNH nuclease domain
MEKERSGLIETILLNLPFPEIYIQVVTDSDTGLQQHVVVDGQQRITSILMFIDGLVSLPDTIAWEGKRFNQLDDNERKRFWEYKVVVRMINTTSEADIRDLFTRLNTNTIALNDQELRNARFIGHFKETSERLADNPFFQSIRLFTAREIRRMEDVEFVSELLLRVVEGVTNKKDMLDTAYADYDEDFPREGEFEEEFNAAIQLLVSLTTDDNATLIKTKSNFYSLFGACIQYYRQHKSVSFRNAAAIGSSIGNLLKRAKSYDPQQPVEDKMVSEYYDAVSRAASDKMRRIKREEIISYLIDTNDKAC